MSQLAWCYEILELHKDSAWMAVQETYQDLLVIWDPERFNEHPRIQGQVIQQRAAIQDAYQCLQQFYQQGGASFQSSPIKAPSPKSHPKPSAPSPPPIHRVDNLAALQELKPEQCYVHNPVDLRWHDLRGQALVGVNWCGATLIGAKLNDANLEGANLSQANLWQAKLERVNLNEAVLVGANLREAHLQRANLKGSILEGATLKRANLEGADLSNAQLQDACFVDANLRGVFFGRVDLQRVRFRGADLSGAIMNGQQLPEGSIY